LEHLFARRNHVPISKQSSAPSAVPFPLPCSLEWIFSPEIVFQGKEGIDAIYHCTSYGDPEGRRSVRITFEGLDSIRICRGEYSPYDLTAVEGVGRGNIVYTVVDSPWLRDRHAYESEHYRNAYEWGGDVDEMLTDYRHFHFAFHDEFVDIIALGIWCELTDERLAEWPLPASHPLSGLSISSPILDSREVDGIARVLRGGSKTVGQLERGSAYCSQPLYAVGTADDVGYQIVLRNPHGVVKTCLLDTMGTFRAEQGGVASIEEAWHLYAQFLEQHR
jgi:hypothetical protein